MKSKNVIVLVAVLFCFSIASPAFSREYQVTGEMPYSKLSEAEMQNKVNKSVDLSKYENSNSNSKEEDPSVTGRVTVKEGEDGKIYRLLDNNEVNNDVNNEADLADIIKNYKKTSNLIGMESIKTLMDSFEELKKADKEANKAEQAYTDAQNDTKNKQTAYKKAQKDTKNKQTAYEKAQKDTKNKQTAYKKAQKDTKNKQTAYNNAKKEAEKIKNKKGANSKEYKNAQTKVAKAKTAYDNAVAKEKKAKTACDKAVANEKKAKTNRDNAKTKENNTLTAFSNAAKKEIEAKKTYDEADDQLKIAKDKYNEIVRDLRNLNQHVESTVITDVGRHVRIKENANGSMYYNRGTDYLEIKAADGSPILVPTDKLSDKSSLITPLAGVSYEYTIELNSTDFKTTKIEGYNFSYDTKESYYVMDDANVKSIKVETKPFSNPYSR